MKDMNVKKKRIFIVDDHQIVRRGLTHFLNSREDLMVCGEAPDANTAIAAINSSSPDILIVDISLGGISGIDLIKSVLSRYTGISILVLTMHDEVEFVERAMKAGARGYVLKSEREEQILEAIRAIGEGGRYLSDSLKDRLLDRILWDEKIHREDPLEYLTDREFEIFRLFGKGLNTRQVSESLGLGISTIGTYRDRIKKKLNLKTTAELMRFAVRHSLKSD